MTERIGEFLVEIGAMSPAQVEEVLRVQGEGEEPRLFGEVAIELGFIDDSALKRYIEERGKA